MLGFLRRNLCMKRWCTKRTTRRVVPVDDRQKDETISRLQQAAQRVGALQERARLEEIRAQRQRGHR